MPRIVLLIIGLAMMAAVALAATRTQASVSPASQGLRAAVGNTSAIEVAAMKCANRRVCRPGRGCAWRKVCKRW
jgi:hypothetical protein